MSHKLNIPPGVQLRVSTESGTKKKYSQKRSPTLFSGAKQLPSQSSARLVGAVYVADQVNNTRAENSRTKRMIQCPGCSDKEERREGMYKPVSPLVVVPRHKLDKLLIQSNSSLGIEDAGPVTRKRKQ
jgi:hypothetical protein